MTEITKEQLEELEEVRSIGCLSDFNDLLEAYTGIKATPYTAYQYFDSDGNYVGDTDNYTVKEILKSAYIKVKR